MSVDHMLYDKDKWFPSASNQVIPKQIIIKSGAYAGNSLDTVADGNTTIEQKTFKCVGMATNQTLDEFNNVGTIYITDGRENIKTTNYPNGFSYNCFASISDKVIPIY